MHCPNGKLCQLPLGSRARITACHTEVFEGTAVCPLVVRPKSVYITMNVCVCVSGVGMGGAIALTGGSRMLVPTTRAGPITWYFDPQMRC
jgi:hypothetical protein